MPPLPFPGGHVPIIFVVLVQFQRKVSPKQTHGHIAAAIKITQHTLCPNLNKTLSSRLLKNPPAAGTGPASHVGFREIPVGRVPSRGDSEVVQHPAGKSAAGMQIVGLSLLPLCHSLGP